MQYQGSFPGAGGLATMSPNSHQSPQTLPPWMPSYEGLPVQIGAPPGGQQGYLPPNGQQPWGRGGRRGGFDGYGGGNGKPPIGLPLPGAPPNPAPTPATGGGGNTLDNLFKLLGLGNPGVSTSSSTQVGDVSQQTGDSLSPLLAALSNMFATQTGADVSFGSQAIQKLLGQEQNANTRFSTQTQQTIADNANKEAARAQAAQYAEAQTRAQSNLDRFNSIQGAGGRGNPLLAAPKTSANIANSLMSGGSMPPMMA